MEDVGEDVIKKLLTSFLVLNLKNLVLIRFS